MTFPPSCAIIRFPLPRKLRTEHWKGGACVLRKVCKMAGFFSPDNWYWKPFAHVGDAVILSSLWTLVSIPLVTFGGATTALYDTVAHCIRGRDRDLLSRFFSTFRREWKGAFCASALWIFLLALCYRAIRAVTGLLPATNGSVMLVAGLFAILTLLAGAASWVLPLLSRFTFSFASLNLTALKLACGHPLRTAAAGICSVLCFALCLRTMFAFLILPELLAVIWAALMEPVFLRYMTEEEQMAVRKCPDDADEPL